jgi:hypothetical protein
MRVFRVFAIALITGIAAAVLVIPVSDYLTQLYHVSNMEGHRGMLIILGIAPLTFIGGFLIGLVTAIVFRRVAGFIKAQGLSLAIVIALTGIVSFILYVAAEKPPTIDGKQLGLEFELRVPATIQITDADLTSNGVSVGLESPGREVRICFIDSQSLRKTGNEMILAGTIPIVWHAAGRQLFTSIGNLRNGSQLIPVDVPAAPRKENEQWSAWIVATEYRDLTPVNESDRMAARYRVRLLE